VIGDGSCLAPGVNCYNMDLVTHRVEYDRVPRAHLWRRHPRPRISEFALTSKPITVGQDVWIGTEAFVGPGAVIPDGVVLGARAVAFGELEPWTVYAGNSG